MSASPISERSFHLIGAGGAGMSGLALAAAELGASVSGSDRSESSYTRRLADAGITLAIGHDAANVPVDAEVVVSTAITDDNPELAVARERGQRVLHRSQLLAELAATRELCITVAGTHGKTTTTGMISHVLDALGEDPSYFVGGELAIGGRTTNAHLGGGRIVVLEADESDGSFEHYAPDVAVVTSLEYDHPETWRDIDQLVDAFRRHVAPAAHVVLPGDLKHRDALELGTRARTFGISPTQADLVADDLTTPADPVAGTSFQLNGLQVELGVRERHNVMNALAAMTALQAAGIELERSASVIGGFRGVARRFELVGNAPSGARVYDDYAHHPTEVAAALAGARGAAAGGRVVAVFQPHMFSRTQTYAEQFAAALTAADVVLALDVYPARERAEDFPGVDGGLIAQALPRESGVEVHHVPTLDQAADLLADLLGPDDLCITIGAGDVTGLAHRIAGS